jgi:hypothetical protein
LDLRITIPDAVELKQPPARQIYSSFADMIGVTSDRSIGIYFLTRCAKIFLWGAPWEGRYISIKTPNASRLNGRARHHVVSGAK